MSGTLFETVTDTGGSEDFWPTPADAIRPVFEVLPKRFGRRTPWTLIEPAAGEGALLRLVFDAMLPARTIAVEVNAERFRELERLDLWREHDRCRRESFFDAPHSTFDSPHPRLWITNPPYSKPRRTIGWEFVERCLTLAGREDCVAMLLPLDYATSVERAELHDHYPCSLYPLKRRPRFANGRTGQRPVAWFVWDCAEPIRRWRIIG